jgi:SAM-dependent methyltransferase
MNIKNTKAAYLEARISENNLTQERINFGNREIKTLKLLANEIEFIPDAGAKILDLGCADKYIAPACEAEGWTYTGLDYMDVDFEDDNLPVQSNSADIVISLAVIEHLKDPQNFLSEIYRCLKPGGLIYLSTPNFQLDFKNFYNDPTHVRPYTPTSIAELLRLSGFKSPISFPGVRCKGIYWYRGPRRFMKAYYLLPFRNDTRLPVPNFLKGHARSIFCLARKPNQP